MLAPSLILPVRNMESMYLAISNPSTNQEDEFLLIRNAYPIHEGPTSFTSDQGQEKSHCSIGDGSLFYTVVGYQGRQQDGWHSLET